MVGIVEREQLISREQFWLEAFRDTFGRDQLYNLKMEAGPGFTHDPETCALISAQKKGHVVVTPEQRAQIAATLTGSKHSEGTRAKVSASLVGNKRSLGFRHSGATKAKLSRAKNRESISLGTIPLRNYEDQSVRDFKGMVGF